MIVVSIISVLAAIALPSFSKMSCRAKQSEAKGNLRAAMAALQAFRAEYDGTDIAHASTGEGCPGIEFPSTAGVSESPIGFQVRGGSTGYSYQLLYDASTGTDGEQAKILAVAFGCRPNNITDYFISWEFFSCPNNNCMIGVSMSAPHRPIIGSSGDAVQLGTDSCSLL